MLLENPNVKSGPGVDPPTSAGPRTSCRVAYSLPTRPRFVTGAELRVDGGPPRATLSGRPGRQRSGKCAFLPADCATRGALCWHLRARIARARMRSSVDRLNPARRSTMSEPSPKNNPAHIQALATMARPALRLFIAADFPRA